MLEIPKQKTWLRTQFSSTQHREYFGQDKTKILQGPSDWNTVKF